MQCAALGGHCWAGGKEAFRQSRLCLGHDGGATEGE